MSGRYEVSGFDHGALKVRDTESATNQYVCIHPGSDPWSAFAHGALRQFQQDLAAVTAERDRLIAELPLSTGRDVNETRERLGPITRIADGPSERAYVCATTAREVVGYVIAERDSAKLRAERAEAQLAEYAEAPTVALVRTAPGTDYKFVSFSVLERDQPGDMTELIARPKVKP